MQPAHLHAITSTLTQRQRAVLQAVVRRYLRTGEAVASSAICTGLKASAATVRMEMARLTEVDLLCQPHTSAGRAPTPAGLQFYVEHLMRPRRPSTAARTAFEAALRADAAPEVRLRAASRQLAEQCTVTVLARRPYDAATLVERLELVYLGAQRVLAVALLEDGAVRHRTVLLDAPVTPELVGSAQRLFAERFAGGPLESVRARLRDELASARESNRPSTPLLRLAASALPASTPPSDAMIIEGRRHLLIAGEVDGLLDTVEEKEMLLGLLEAFGDASNPRVIVGADRAGDVLRGRALITAPYGPIGRARGAVAVIGPRRMRYATVVPWVNFAARALSRLAESAA